VREARRQIAAAIELTKEQIGVHARQYAMHALTGLAEEALFGEGLSRVHAARELLDRGYGKIPEPAPESTHAAIEGIVIEPLRQTDGNGHDGPVKLEDWRKLK
jgi:hypothetical protein